MVHTRPYAYASYTKQATATNNIQQLHMVNHQDNNASAVSLENLQSTSYFHLNNSNSGNRPLLNLHRETCNKTTSTNNKTFSNTFTNNSTTTSTIFNESSCSYNNIDDPAGFSQVVPNSNDEVTIENEVILDDDDVIDDKKDLHVLLKS